MNGSLCYANTERFRKDGEDPLSRSISQNNSQGSDNGDKDAGSSSSYSLDIKPAGGSESVFADSIAIPRG